MAAATELPPFRFQPRRGKLDWRTLSTLDLGKLERDVDIDTLERHLAGVAFAEVTQNGAPSASWLSHVSPSL